MSVITTLVSIALIFASYLWGNCNCSSSSQLAPALYVFGDSLFDVGTNNWLPTLAKSNYLPYGSNFRKGPTGRFTNGKILPDFIADFLGLPYPPPYIKPFRSNTLEGYNYASGACGILPETGKDTGFCLDLDDQMKLFKETVKENLSSKLKTELSAYMAKSIFIFSIGNNDYLGNYYGSSSDIWERDDTQQFTQLLIDRLSEKLKMLYSLGARKVVVFELGPLGCLESMVRRFNPNGRCVEKVNQVASDFNNQLALMLNNLTYTLEYSHFILGHANRLGYDAIMNPRKYGLSDTRNPCCKTWGNGTLTCIPLLKPCSNPDQHFFWDGAHLTQAINSLIASECIQGSSVCHPLNIQQLVQA